MNWAPGPTYEVPDPKDGVPNRHESIHTAINYNQPRPTPMPVTRSVYDATFDRAYRERNPYLSGRNRLNADYSVNRDATDSMGYSLGQAINRGIHSAYSTDGKALLTNGLGGAALGVGGIAALNALRSAQGKEKLGWKSRLLAALAGVGAGTALTMQMRGGSPQRTTLNRMEKGASWPQVPLEQMRQDIMARTAQLDYETRNNVRGALGRLSPDDLGSLHRLVTTAFGAAAGAIVTRWLMGKGLLPLVIGGTIGGLLGHRFGGPPRNAFGRTSLDAYR